jgi:hypothetical protein
MWCGGAAKREALAKLWSGEMAPALEVRPCTASGKGLGLFAGEGVLPLLLLLPCAVLVQLLLSLWSCELAPALEVRPCTASDKGLGLFAGEGM